MLKSFDDFSFKEGILLRAGLIAPQGHFRWARTGLSELARLGMWAPVNDYSCTAVRLAIQSFFAHLRQGFFVYFTGVSA